MRRIAIIIQYDGTNYFGFQKQKDRITVCGCLEEAGEKLLKQKIKICGSGRTDKGVHALGQCAHFDCVSKLLLDKIVLGFNYYLPKDIRVIDAKEVDNNFDARKSVKKKTYIYKIYESKIENPLRKNVYCSHNNLDVNRMLLFSKILVGEHDFSSFCKFNNQKSTVRTIYNIDIKKENESITIVVCANGFLYNMMRIIVYVLIKIGEGENINLEYILKNKNRSLINGLAPSNALYLYKVEY